MLRFDDVPAGLIAVLSKLDLYRQIRWQSYEQDDRREPTDKLTEAVCASSRIREQEPSQRENEADADSEMHYLMIDLDVPAFLVPSTHPGHSHLYVEQPIVWRDLEQLLRALAACGVIEHGYANASVDRKATTLRLPWVSKEPEGDDTLIPIAQVRNILTELSGPGQYEGQVGMGFLATFDQWLDELANGEARRPADSMVDPEPPMTIHQAGPEGIPPEVFLSPDQRRASVLTDDEFSWRQVLDSSGAYAHQPHQHVYPGEGNWNAISCSTRGHHNLCYAPRPAEPPSMMDPPGYRSKWMDVGDKLRAPEKYDVIDERHSCVWGHKPCGMTEWHDWHDYIDPDDGVPRHCPGKRPGGA